MKKLFVPLTLLILLLSLSTKTFAWGRRGHRLVAEIAYRFLDSATKQKLHTYLGTMTPDEAGNWMDDQRSNSFYEFMRTWHYLDFEKGEEYKPVAERNILTVLNAAYLDLKHYNDFDKKEIKKDILLIFHLVGDLHQPLHVGYASDRGGNDVSVASNLVSGNLHSIWDTQIVELKDVTIDDCLKVYESMNPAEVEQVKRINFLKWFRQSRSLLDSVYGYQNNFLDQTYIDNSTVIIKKQLMLGGLRLASVLTDLFGDKAGTKSAGLPALPSILANVKTEQQAKYCLSLLGLFVTDKSRRTQVC